MPVAFKVVLVSRHRMFTLTVLLVALTGALAIPHPPAHHRIIGGEDAKQGQFPGMVSLRLIDLDFFFCGGAIIAPDLILSSAFCLKGYSPSRIEVVAGFISVSQGGTRIQAKNIVYHEDFGADPTGVKNDIGLVLLNSSLSYTPDIQPLKLDGGNTVNPGDTVTALGWGSTSFPELEQPDILQYVTSEIWSNADCASKLVNDTIYAEQICFGGVDGKGTCFGDSGSPLIANGDTTVGIISWGVGCAVGYPDVSTRVSEYVDWINENAQKLRQE